MNQRQQFAETTTRLMAENERIVLLLPDVGVYGFREAFAKFPERCYNLGPAEAATVGIAAGLAKEGFYPVVHSFSSFLCRRAYEQIYLDFGEQKLSGMFVGIHGVEKFGASHVCKEDAHLMATVRDMRMHLPHHPNGVDDAINEAVSHGELAYVRLT